MKRKLKVRKLDGVELSSLLDARGGEWRRSGGRRSFVTRVESYAMLESTAETRESGGR